MAEDLNVNQKVEMFYGMLLLMQKELRPISLAGGKIIAIPKDRTRS